MLNELKAAISSDNHNPVEDSLVEQRRILHKISGIKIITKLQLYDQNVFWSIMLLFCYLAGSDAPFLTVLFTKSTYFVIILGAPLKWQMDICIKWSTGIKSLPHCRLVKSNMLQHVAKTSSMHCYLHNVEGNMF